MNRSIPATFVLLFRVIWIYVATGALFRLMRLRKGPVIAALYPIFMLMGQLLAGVLLGWLTAVVISLVLPLWVGSVTGVAVLVFLMRWFRTLDNRLFAYYLLHDCAF